jgi:hypothetical protein
MEKYYLLVITYKAIGSVLNIKVFYFALIPSSFQRRNRPHRTVASSLVPFQISLPRLQSFIHFTLITWHTFAFMWNHIVLRSSNIFCILISYTAKNHKYPKIFMENVCYFQTKTWMWSNIFVKISSVKYHKILSSGSQILVSGWTYWEIKLQIDGQT